MVKIKEWPLVTTSDIPSSYPLIQTSASVPVTGDGFVLLEGMAASLVAFYFRSEITFWSEAFDSSYLSHFGLHCG